MRKRVQTWQIQEAKQRFSEVIRHAAVSGPQQITKAGEETAWILSAKDYHRLAKGRSKNLVQFFKESPHRTIEIASKRSQDLPRDIDL